MVLSIKDNILLFKVSNMSIKLQELSNDTTIIKHYIKDLSFENLCDLNQDFKKDEVKIIKKRIRTYLRWEYRNMDDLDHPQKIKLEKFIKRFFVEFDQLS